MKVRKHKVDTDGIAFDTKSKSIQVPEHKPQTLTTLNPPEKTTATALNFEFFKNKERDLSFLLALKQYKDRKSTKLSKVAPPGAISKDKSIINLNAANHRNKILAKELKASDVSSSCNSSPRNGKMSPAVDSKKKPIVNTTVVKSLHPEVQQVPVISDRLKNSCGLNSTWHREIVTPKEETKFSKKTKTDKIKMSWDQFLDRFANLRKDFPTEESDFHSEVRKDKLPDITSPLNYKTVSWYVQRLQTAFVTDDTRDNNNPIVFHFHTDLTRNSRMSSAKSTSPKDLDSQTGSEVTSSGISVRDKAIDAMLDKMEDTQEPKRKTGRSVTCEQYMAIATPLRISNMSSVQFTYLHPLDTKSAVPGSNEVIALPVEICPIDKESALQKKGIDQSLQDVLRERFSDSTSDTKQSVGKYYLNISSKKKENGNSADVDGGSSSHFFRLTCDDLDKLVNHRYRQNRN